MTSSQGSLPETHLAVELKADREIRLVTIPRPKIVHPDDAIIRVNFAGLCGSDLHPYRGHYPPSDPYVMGHEYCGEVVELGSSFRYAKGTDAAPTSHDEREGVPLYGKLRVGDAVIGAFTVTCNECGYCRLGFTSRCEHCFLFGSPQLPGAQAQFLRIPKAGGTLHRLADLSPRDGSKVEVKTPAAFLVLGDIVPTGYFAAFQAMSHPNVQLRLKEKLPFPFTTGVGNLSKDGSTSRYEEGILSIAIVGLGPVGICALLALLHLLETEQPNGYRILAVDPNPQRRGKVERILQKIKWPKTASGDGVIRVVTPEEALSTLKSLVGDDGSLKSPFGCDAVLDAVGNESALQLSYDLIRAFGVISSVGVHTAKHFALNGVQLYAKNVALCFGRCPVGAMFPHAVALFFSYPEVFGSVGTEESLIERVIGMGDEAAVKAAYTRFDAGEWGKVVFRPWN